MTNNPNCPNDFIGKKIGSLTILGLHDLNQAPTRKNWVDWKYDCHCDCGNNCISARSLLRRRKENMTCPECSSKKSIDNLIKHGKSYKKDIKVGDRFGRLVITEELEEKVPDGRGYFVEQYKCNCDCGNKGLIYSRLKFIGEPIQSCGCMHSLGEKEIKNFLLKEGVLFDSEKTFKECRDIQVLPFDFQIFYPNTDIFFLCEYQGIQHYQPVKFDPSWTDEEMNEKLRYTQLHDKIKQDFCKNNNIALIIIPYWEYSNIEKILREEINRERR